MTLVARTHSADETRALAAGVGSLARAGDVILLGGDLGAGKTVFTKGLAAALGITEPVLSPTFVIMREYSGPLPLVHVDVYRLDHVQELHDIGFDEVVGEQAVTVVEWGDRVGAALPVERLEIRLDFAPDAAAPDERIVTVEPCGPTWAARLEALEAAVAAHAPAGSDADTAREPGVDVDGGADASGGA